VGAVSRGEDIRRAQQQPMVPVKRNSQRPLDREREIRTSRKAPYSHGATTPRVWREPGGHTALVSDSAAESSREGASILFRFLVAVAWMVAPVVLGALGIYKSLSWPDAPTHRELVDGVQFLILGGLAAFVLPFAGLIAAKLADDRPAVTRWSVACVVGVVAALLLAGLAREVHAEDLSNYPPSSCRDGTCEAAYALPTNLPEHALARVAARRGEAGR
jgi:hypothetical protein